MITFPISKRSTRAFNDHEEGSVSVEAVLVFPLLIWAITATFVFFDAFKSLHSSQKATYAVADMISRETSAVDDDYLTAMHEMFSYIARDEIGNSSIRFTVVQRVEDEFGVEDTTLVWSEGVNGAVKYENLDLLEGRIPQMMVGDQLVVVETEHEWSPTFAVGLATYRFREVGISRPRFAPQLCYDDGIGSAPVCSPATGSGGTDAGDGDTIPGDGDTT